MAGQRTEVKMVPCLLCWCPVVGSSTAGGTPRCSTNCMVGLGALTGSQGPLPGRQPHG